MTIDSNRLLLEFEKLRREVNRSVINPAIPDLNLKSLQPLITLVAEARRDYLAHLLELAKSAGTPLAPEQVAALKARRESYEELANAASALETAIQREYLDVQGSRRD